MKKVQFLLSSFFVIGMATGAAHFIDDTLLPKWYNEMLGIFGVKPEAAGSYVGSNVKGGEWIHAKSLQQKLAEEIKVRLSDTDGNEMRKALADPQTRLLLAQWLMARAELEAETAAPGIEQHLQKQVQETQSEVDELLARRESMGSLPPRDERRLEKLRRKLAQQQTEAELPRVLSKALVNEQKKQLMETLGNNLDWLEQMVYTGHMVQPAKVLNILSDIQKQHPDMQSNQMVRDIATATALEFAKSEWLHDVALDRADYFITHWKQGDLNTVFDTLPFWERRMVCGCWGDNAFGGRPSLEWALENVRLPADRYTQDCPHHLYRLHNLYGETVHGPHYVEPYEDLYEDNMCRFVIEVGGICGNLSKFCTFSALANGIPALTTGEPGHCSYVVKEGDKWVPGYSLSWERGLQWLPWPGMNVFSCLHMATELYSPAEKENTRLSHAYRVLAGVYGEADAGKAIHCYTEAVKAQPLNIYAWREYADLLAQTRKGDLKAWEEFNELLCTKLVKRYPEVAAQVAEQMVYPGLKDAAGADAAIFSRAFLSFWFRVDAMGPDRWRIEKLLNAQKSYLCEKELTPAMFTYYENLLRSMSSNSAYAPVLFSWGNSLTADMNKEDQARMISTMIKGMGGSSLDDESRRKMLNPIILAAEKARDMTTFQELSKMLPAENRNPAAGLPEHEVFPGQLMSRGGLLWASSTSPWDHPCKHWGILEPGVGGEFHSAWEKNPWVVVQLPRQTKVTGVVAINRPGNMNRVEGMVLQVSETGKDDDWHDVATFTQNGHRVFRAPTGDKLPVAKYIRIYRTGDCGEPFHLSGIYVYGFPSA